MEGLLCVPPLSSVSVLPSLYVIINFCVPVRFCVAVSVFMLCVILRQSPEPCARGIHHPAVKPCKHLTSHTNVPHRCSDFAILSGHILSRLYSHKQNLLAPFLLCTNRLEQYKKAYKKALLTEDPHFFIIENYSSKRKAAKYIIL